MNRADTLPRWAYRLLALACVCMGLWASSITLQYFEHGSRALESDVSLQALAVAAALMFVASEMGAFALAALLSDRQLLARRWALTVFAACVLGLEVVTIVAVQMALTTGADLTQVGIVTRAAGLQRQIDAVEQTVAAFSASAEALRADKQVSKAMRASDRAATEQAKTAVLYAELAQIQSQQRPTLVGLLGKEYALAYAVARGILVSLGGLVFFGAAGTLLRAARGSGAPAAPALPTQPSASPARPSFKQSGEVVPKGPKNVAMGLVYSSKTALAGAGALAVLAAPMAHAVPMQEKSPATPLVTPVKSALQTVHTGASVLDAGALVSVQSGAKKMRVKRAVSAQIDTGTGGKTGARFRRVKAGVIAGKIKPSIRGIQAIEGGSQAVVIDYLKQLADDGVITHKGRGWALATKGGAA